MDVQEAFACCGFNDKTPEDDPKMGHPSCEAVKVCYNLKYSFYFKLRNK